MIEGVMEPNRKDYTIDFKVTEEEIQTSKLKKYYEFTDFINTNFENF